MNGHVDSADMSTSAGMWTPADSPMVTEANTPNPVSDAPQYVVHTQQPTTTTTAAMEKFHRIDTLHLKRKLFEAMGSNESSGESEQARSYWQYLGQFVRGKLRREEFIELIAEVLDTHYKGESLRYVYRAVIVFRLLTRPGALLHSDNAQPPPYGNLAQRRVYTTHRVDSHPTRHSVCSGTHG